MAGEHILYVENDKTYSNPISSALRAQGYVVEVANDKDEAIGVLGKSRFDLLLVNMHLGPFLDHYGDSVLAAALERFPEMPRVVISGNKPERPFLGTQQLEQLERYFGRYKLAEFFHKGPDLDIEVFCERITQIIAQKGSAVTLEPKRRVRNKIYEVLPGANWDILSYLMRCNVLDDIFDGVSDYLDYLYTLLSSPQPDERYVAAHHLWTGLWLKEKGLPYFDMMRLLMDHEVDGSLYQGYRDHVVHSVLSFILGLYFYHGNSIIREALTKEFPQQQDFFTTWKIAALFHDIGYLLNVDHQYKPDIESYLLTKVQAYLRQPLHLYCTVRELSLSEQDESRLRLKAKPYVRELSKLQDLRISMSGQYPLDVLDDIIRGVHLVAENRTGILSHYDAFVKVTPPKGHDYPVEDHGILSALLLICQFEYFNDYTQKVCPAAVDEPTIPQKTRDILSTLPLQVNRYQVPIQHASAAIALHNVNVDIWNIDDAKEQPYYLTLDSYELSLQQSPLAFLLAMTDALQCWDRPMRTLIPHALKDCAWQSADVRIICEEDKIKICFLRDPEYRRGTPDSIATKLLGEMKHYMNPASLDMLQEIREPL